MHCWRPSVTSKIISDIMTFISPISQKVRHTLAKTQLLTSRKSYI